MLVRIRPHPCASIWHICNYLLKQDVNLKMTKVGEVEADLAGEMLAYIKEVAEVTPVDVKK